jgi:predicted nucleic acid-binding protein
MTLFVDTSVWSLAFRRDQPTQAPEVAALVAALADREDVVTTGLVLQELLRGFRGPHQQERIVTAFEALPLVIPDRRDHVRASVIGSDCRRKGIQVGTIDVVLAALCLRHELTMLSTDRDFERIAAHHDLELWQPTQSSHAGG